MITFKTIKWRNFLSTGNTWSTIDLNKHHSTLIIGVNGAGKCVRGNTQIEISFDPKQNPKLVTIFNNRKYTTVKDIVDIYAEYPELIGKINVNTQYGYKAIEYAAITAHNSEVYTITTKYNDILSGSPDHRILIKQNDTTTWITLKELTGKEIVLTKYGYTELLSAIKESYTEDLYDLQVAEVQEYYSNNIVSHNSTLLDALCFGLYGVPFRNIKKPTLINSINEKQLEVEIEFDIDNKQYKVCRGMKPNKFEIYDNNILINQDAATKDYQKVLEDQIIKFSYRAFTQVVILGSASFVPFMKLTAMERREVIEDLIDIKIFSLMNQILKEKYSGVKSDIEKIDSNISFAKEKVKSQEKLINVIETAQSETQSKIQEKIDNNYVLIESLQTTNNELTNQINDLTKFIADEATVKSDIKKVTKLKTKIEAKIDNIHEQISFLTEQDDCPSCKQKIDHEHKVTTILDFEHQITSLNAEKKTFDICLDKLNNKLNNINEYNNKISNLNIEAVKTLNSITMLNKENRKLLQETAQNKLSDSNLAEEKTKLKELAENVITLINNRRELIDTKNLQDIASILLRDSGIKTSIIKEYLPLLNKYINKYLNVMDSFIHFELDENFKEVIKSRHRDEFTYASFSEGEKSRINLALTFAWRQIAKMKNSINTNLLIFDEVMDSSLDESGSELFMSLINEFKDNNVFVISHTKEAMADKFDNVIKVKKVNNYSVLEQQE